MKKKPVLPILFLIIAVIYMCIAIIPLVHLSKLDTTSNVTESSKVSIFSYMFFYMFLSINFLNAGVSLFLNNKIEKILSITRIIFIAIIVFIFLCILETILFPIRFILFIT